MDLIIVEEKPVYVWRGAFSPLDCGDLASDPDWPRESYARQCVVQNSRVAARLGARFFERMPGAEKIPGLGGDGWLPHVTYSRRRTPIDWHVDRSEGALYKVFAYLNEAPGTIFGKLELRFVPASLGTIVAFDIRLEHCGEGQDVRREKVTLGLRPAPPPA